MRKTLMFLATAAAVAGSAVAGSAVAQDHGSRWDRTDRFDRSDRSDRADRSDRGGLTAHQLAAEADVSIARMKADLRLTADQEKNWSAMETALRDVGEKRAERAVALRTDVARQDAVKQDGTRQDSARQDSTRQDSTKPDGTKQDAARPDAPDDFIASLNRSSVNLSERAADIKKLADAAQPLYVSLDAQQKRRFSQALMRITRDN